MNPVNRERINSFLKRMGGMNGFSYRELELNGGTRSVGGGGDGGAYAGCYSTDHCLSQCTSKTTLTIDSSHYRDQYSLPEIYEVNNHNLEIVYNSPLGSGNFGVVYKGILSKSNGDWKVVAVKVIKETYDNLGSNEEMHRELGIMKELQHENIVRIEGCSMNQNIIIMEYIKEGSLDNYLRVNKDRIHHPRQLFGFANNIVDGMDYMASKGIIHRDLAARNVLVADEETVKISDFGLARLKTEGKEYYMMSSNANIPVRWMSIESLNENKYTPASDIWSFGVVLWEMFSFGKTPNLKECEDFFTSVSDENKIVQDYAKWVELLQNGIRLPCPDNCPPLVYTHLMLPCWAGDPRDRPTFQEMHGKLKEIELRVT